MTQFIKQRAALVLTVGLSSALAIAGAPAKAQPTDLRQHPEVQTMPADVMGTNAAPAMNHCKYCGPRGGER